MAALTDALRGARIRRAGLQARVDALALGLHREGGAGTLLDRGGPHARCPRRGRRLRCRSAPGYETAIAAALGAVGDAVAVRAVPDAAAALRRLRDAGGGRAGILVRGARTMPDQRQWPALPTGVRWAVDLITAADLQPAVARVLDRVAVVRSLDEAVDVVGTHPDVRAVTLGGDLLGPDWAAGGSGTQSVLEIQAAADRAADELVEVTATIAALEGSLAAATDEARQHDDAAAATLAQLHESDARMSAVGEDLARRGVAAREAHAELARLERQRAVAESATATQGAAVAELEARLRAAEFSDEPVAVDPARRDELAARDGGRPAARGRRPPRGADRGGAAALRPGWRRSPAPGGARRAAGA